MLKDLLCCPQPQPTKKQELRLGAHAPHSSAIRPLPSGKMMAGDREHSRRVRNHCGFEFRLCASSADLRLANNLYRVGWRYCGEEPCEANNERASRSIEPRLPRRHGSALPFGKDTGSKDQHSGSIDPDQPLATTSIAPAVNATRPHAVLMAIFFSLFCASGLFGSVTVSTPFLKCASILSASTPSGTPKERWKEP